MVLFPAPREVDRYLYYYSNTELYTSRYRFPASREVDR